MSDNITLPRAVAFEMLEALTCGEHIGNFYAALYAALAAPEPEPTVKESLTVDAALAEPEQKPEPVAWMESPHGAIRANPLYRITAPQSLAWSIPLYTHLPAASPEPPAKPEPATVEQIDEEYIGPVIDARWHDFEAGFRAAERFHGIGGSKT